MAKDRGRRTLLKRLFGSFQSKSKKAAAATVPSDASIPSVLVTTDSATARDTEFTLRGASTKQSGMSIAVGSATTLATTHDTRASLTLSGEVSTVCVLPDSTENPAIAQPSSNINTDPIIQGDPALESSQSNSTGIVDTISPPSTRSKFGLHRMNPTNCEQIGSLDIIAIHGINGDPFKTWTCETTGGLWLRDFLPDDVPGARVFSFGYDAQVCFSKSISGINEFAIMLLNHLLVNRSSKDFQSRPLIFICHSMGGIIVKQALVTAQLNQTEYALIQKSLKAIFFFGTPHQGSDIVEWPILLDNVAKFSLNLGVSSWGKIRRDLLKSLERNSEDLYALSVNFRNQIDGIRLVTFYEQQFTSPLRSVVVDKKSSTLAIPGEKLVPMAGCDHRTVCRFGDKYDFNYQLVLHEILPFTGVPDASLEVPVISLETSVPSSKIEEEELIEIHKECLASLFFYGLEDRERDIQDPVDDTCAWLAKHDKFQKWLLQGRGLLLLKGKPGAGKSTLLKHTLRQMRTAPFVHDSRQVLTLSFFFNGRGSELHKSPLGLFRSILFQVARNVPIARDTVTQRFKEKSIVGKPGEAWDWHPKELCELIANVLPKILEEYSIRLFVDALDECLRTNEADEDQLENFWKLFSNACAICISHREFPLVNLNSELEVHVDEENRPDIETYVRKKLSPDQDELRKLIIKSSHGIFMWTVLVVAKVSRRLREKEDRKTIMSEIRRFPQGLGKLYEQLLEAVPEEDKNKTLKLMRWICFSRRPLSLDNMRFAMVVNANTKIQTLDQYRAMPDFTDSNKTMESRVKRYSCGLAEIRIHHRRKTIQFIHQSVSDFFMEIGLQIMDPNCVSQGSAIGRAHLFLSRSCINFIATEDIQDLDELKESSWHGGYLERAQADSTLAIYATKYWTIHAHNAEMENTQADILETLGWPAQDLFEKWKCMSQVMGGYSFVCLNEGTTILHTLSMNGLITPLSSILQRTNQPIPDINIRDANGRTSLSWAAEKGYTAIVKLLLDKGADPNHYDEINQTPLSWAGKEGHTDVVKLLVNKGVNLNQLDWYDRTAFWWAVANENEALVKWLLAHARLDPNRGQAPLVQGARSGNQTLVKILLADDRVDLYAVGSQNETPLHAAAERGHEGIVRLLLANDHIDPNAVGDARITPLHLAAEMGHEGIVRLLLTDDRVDPDPRDVFGQTPFSRASGEGHEAVLRLLWATKRINSNSIDESNNSPMILALIRRNDSIVKWLLSLDPAVPNSSVGSFKGLPAFGNYQARSVHDAILNLLLQSCAWKQKVKDAARIRYEIAIELLLERDNSTLDSKYHIGQRLSRYKQEDQDLALLESFIRNHYLSVYEFEDNDGRRLISYAIEYGHMQVVELLIGKDNRWVNSRDRQVRSPLYWAAVKEQKLIRDFLRSRGGTL